MIQQLTLTNFKRHESLTLDFNQGLTTLAGANEAGKSTILHAILYALGGSRALPRSLEATVTYGKPVASLRVEMSFTVGGTLYKVTRSKAGAELQGAGSLSSGQAEVTAAIERLLGANVSVASKLLIANQGDLRGVVSQGSEAVKLIEQLANLDAIEVLVDKIQNQLPTGSTAALCAQVETLERLEAPVLVDMSAEVSAAEAEAWARRSLLSAAEAEAAAHRLALDDVLEIAAAHASYKAKVDALTSVVNAPRTEPQIYTMTDIAVLEAAQARQAEDAVKLTMWQAWSQVVPAADPGPAPISTAAAEVHKIEMQLQAAKLRRINEDSCALCGKLLQDVPEVVAGNAAVDAEVSALSAELERLRDLQKVETTERSEWEVARKAHEAFKLACARLSNFVSDGQWVAGEINFEIDKTDYTRRIKDEREKLRHVAVQAERIRLEDAAREKAAAELANLGAEPPFTDPAPVRAAVLNAQNRVKQLADAYRVAEAAWTNLSREQARRQAAFSAETSAFEAAAFQRQSLKATIMAMEKHNALIKKLRLARPVIASKLWAGLLGAIGSTFSSLRGSNSLVGRDADGFTVDGKSAADLSGSTLDILGLAVRVSLLRAFLPGVGFLILDEPAAAMDESRESTLLGLLATLGLSQVLMVSHSEAAKAVAETLVEI